MNEKDRELADWLINYRGGFLRRGLAGECIYWLHHWTSFSFDSLLGVWLVVLQAALLTSWYCLVRRSSLSAWVLAALLSPAALSFSVLDFSGGFRKDLFLLAGLSALVAILPKIQISDLALSAALSLFAIWAVLTHEASIFFLGYLVAILVACGHPLQRTFRVCLVPGLLAAVCAVLSVHSHVGLGNTEAICRSLGYTLNKERSSEVCQYGAIWYLTFSGHHALHETIAGVRLHHAVRFYSLMGALAAMPLLLGTFALARQVPRRLLVTCWTTATLCFCGSLALFAFAVDWGRWIHMHAVLMSCVLLTLDGRYLDSGTVVSSPGRAWSTRLPVLAIVLLFATSWNLPLTYVSQPLRGYYGMAQQISADVRAQRSRF